MNPEQIVQSGKQSPCPGSGRKDLQRLPPSRASNVSPEYDPLGVRGKAHPELFSLAWIEPCALRIMRRKPQIDESTEPFVAGVYFRLESFMIHEDDLTSWVAKLKEGKHPVIRPAAGGS